MVEIQVRLQKAFLALVATERDAFSDAAQRHSAMALTRAESDLKLKEDKQAVRTLAAQIDAYDARGALSRQ
jgi:uncharacterized membrane protein